MKRFALAAISIALLIISACTQQTPDLPKEMVMDTTEFSFSAEGGKIELKFIPLYSWTALCEEDWVNCSQLSGEASAEEAVLTIAVSENKGFRAFLFHFLLFFLFYLRHDLFCKCIKIIINSYIF